MRHIKSVIILSGGSSRRFGSDKYLAELSGKRLLDHVLVGLPEDCAVFLVGDEPENLLREVITLRESPIKSGPVAAISAALTFIKTEFVAIIATDMPFAPALLETLMENFDDGFDAIVPEDRAGFAQPLSAIYKTEGLRRGMRKLGAPENRSMNDLLKQMKIKPIKLTSQQLNYLLDIDTQEDLAKAENLAGGI